MSRRLTIAFGLNLVDPHAADYYGWSGPLKACVNDASAMVALAGQRGHDLSTSLVNTYAGTMTAQGGTLDTITVIPPYRLVMNATAAAFIDRHRELAAQAQPGDLYVFTYSGHGADRRYVLERTQSLCFGDRMMDENEFRELWALWPAGVRVAYILDCCHAGGMFRTAPGQMIAMPKTAGIIHETTERSAHRGPSQVNADILVMSAATQDQYALDGEQNGAYTGSLLATINDNPSHTWGSQHEGTRTFMAKHFPSQEPTLNVWGDTTVWNCNFMR